MNKNIMVFAPHPDDETFWCGGTIVKKISEGFNVFIVIITDGGKLLERNQRNSNLNSLEIIDIRKKELCNATKLMGVSRENLIFLNYEDGMLYSYITKLNNSIEILLKKYRPVEVFFPYINDGHLDHQVTNSVVSNCLIKLNLHSKKYQYHGLHKYSRVGPIYERIKRFIKKSFIEVDVSNYLNIKEMAIKEFKIEMDIISRGNKYLLQKKLKKYLHKKEIFYI